MKNVGFATKAIHESGARKGAVRASRFPVHAGVAFDFESAEATADCLFGRNLDFVYSRISNPTVEVFEEIKKLGVDDGLVRISAGIEDADDLIGDIREALEGIAV
jgi:O-acetylhomoserine/O-acetylserine sulfhydrylase-like pyridoxal-dependent enzyme